MPGLIIVILGIFMHGSTVSIDDSYHYQQMTRVPKLTPHASSQCYLKSMNFIAIIERWDKTALVLLLVLSFGTKHAHLL
jgi:hypothetical protein